MNREGPGAARRAGFPHLIPNPLRAELVTAVAARGDRRILFFFPSARQALTNRGGN